jgi:hypothetical protein
LNFSNPVNRIIVNQLASARALARSGEVRFMSSIQTALRPSFSERHVDKRSIAALAGETALTVEEVCTALRVSRAWLYSPAGKAAVGEGFKLGGSRRYRSSVISAVLSAGSEATAPALLQEAI